MPGTKVQEHGGSDKAMVWSCVDFADESQRMELFCIRFASPGAPSSLSSRCSSSSWWRWAVHRRSSGGDTLGA